ncbi:MAG: hypothetical protein CMJ78_02700 [Planctomycetaceae bacterium]|nr:hypothetical protein [Planctomycetaceae bacterium]
MLERRLNWRDRLQIIFDCALCLGVLLAWMAARAADDAPMLTDFVPGQFYAVKTSTSTTVPISFDADDRYGLILSNLANKPQDVRLTFEEASTSTPVRNATAFEFRPLDKLPPLTEASKSSVAAHSIKDETRSFFCM